MRELGILLVLESMTPSMVFAESALVERGCELSQRPDFPGALAAFDDAMSSDSLERSDLVRLLECRVLVYYATNATESMDADLLRLASLEPGYQFDERFPPDIVEAFARHFATLEGPLAVTVDQQRVDDSVHLQARAEGDIASLVRSVHIVSQTEAGWRIQDDQLTLGVGQGEQWRYFAQAIGPGGAVIAQDRDESDPYTVGGDDSEDSDESADWVYWTLGGVGAAVAVGVVIALVVGLSPGLSDNTRVDPPSTR